MEHKTVPLTYNGVIIGTAKMDSDGRISAEIDSDTPKELKDILYGTDQYLSVSAEYSPKERDPETTLRHISLLSLDIYRDPVAVFRESRRLKD